MEMLDKNPLVSVVIPTIRYDHYTEKAILSIYAQSYKNWEIILVLDGASRANVPSWVLESSKIRLIEQKERMGTPFSLNNGVEKADGEYIARLDADDIAHPERLRTQVDLLQKHNEICCIGAASYLINEEGKYLGALVSTVASLDIRSVLLVKNTMIHSSVMYRKKLFMQIGGYNSKMRRSQDYDLFLRMAQHAPLAYTEQILCAYRIHEGQHSRKTSPFANYTFELLKQRNALAKSQRVSLVIQNIRNLAWYTAQVLRYTGLRKVGYLREIKVGERGQDFEWIDPSR